MSRSAMAKQEANAWRHEQQFMMLNGAGASANEDDTGDECKPSLGLGERVATSARSSQVVAADHFSQAQSTSCGCTSVQSSQTPR